MHRTASTKEGCAVQDRGCLPCVGAVHYKRVRKGPSSSMSSPHHTMEPSATTAPFKVVLLGNSGVGKTNLLAVMNGGKFSKESKSTIGVEFVTKRMNVDGAIVKAQIWDTAGQERFSAMMGTYFRRAAGALMVYDVSNKDSLSGIERWKQELLHHATEDVFMVLVGNKCDVSDAERKVLRQEGAEYAHWHDMEFIEASAKEKKNVNEAFTLLMNGIYRKRLKQGAAGHMAKGSAAKVHILSREEEHALGTDCC
jgi:Ras-related protein Rab-11A